MLKKTKAPVRQKKREATSDVVRQMEIQVVRIIESSSKLVIAGNKKLPGELGTSMNATFQAPGDGNIVGDVMVSVSSKEDESTPSDEPRSSMEITLRCQCVFRSVEGQVPEDEADYVIASTLQIAWPYIRNHVNLISLGMGIAPVVLPLMKVSTVMSGLRK